MTVATLGRPIILRLDADLVKRLDHLTVDYDLFRNELFRLVLKDFLERYERNDVDIARLRDRFGEKASGCRVGVAYRR